MLMTVFYYLKWHYSKALSDLIELAKNFIWFTFHFFSIGLLFQTFFTPWKRLSEQNTKGFSLEGFMSAIIVTTIMRLVGMIVRTFVILFGLISILAMVVTFIIAFVIWLLAPILLVAILVMGLYYIFYKFPAQK